MGPAYAQLEDAESLFIERAALRAANANCQILTSDETNALDMGYWLVRTTLIRSGRSLDQIDRVGEEAANYAATKACDDPALEGATARLTDAFKAFARIPFMEFPGEARQWTATRTLTDVWAAWQATPQEDARFGLIYPVRASDPLAFAEPDEEREPFMLAAMLALDPSDKMPATARLVFRDSKITPEPWLGGLFGDMGAQLPTPPRAFSTQVFANSRKLVDAPPYADDNKTPGALFMFDPSTRPLLEALDPREAILIEFLPSDRDRTAKVRRIRMEVGDFQAASAFASIARKAKMSAPPSGPKPSEDQIAAAAGAH